MQDLNKWVITDGDNGQQCMKISEKVFKIKQPDHKNSDFEFKMTVDLNEYSIEDIKNEARSFYNESEIDEMIQNKEWQIFAEIIFENQL